MAKITCGLIIQCVAEYFGTTKTELRSMRRPRHMTLPRQAYCWLARELTEKSLPVIGRHLGDRDHTTAYYHIAEVDRKLGQDPALRALLKDLETIVRATALTLERLGIAGPADIDAVEVADRVLHEPLSRCHVTTDELRVLCETVLAMNHMLAKAFPETGDIPAAGAAVAAS